MKKKTNFFPHDSNARNDEKIIRLRMKHGVCGYGIYFMLLERLRDEADLTSALDYNMIAYDLRVPEKLVESVIKDFDLFTITDDGRFYSESFNERLNTIKQQRAKAANARWNNTDKLFKTEGIMSQVKVEEATTNDNYINELLSNESWQEVVCMHHKIDKLELIRQIKIFELDCRCSGIKHVNLKDAQQHFNNWLKKVEQDKSNNNGKDNRRASKRVTAKQEDFKTTF